MLTLAAYNAGEGTIQNAMGYARSQGIATPKFDDLIRGGHNSPLWQGNSSVDQKWVRDDAKMAEISRYAPEIIKRSRQ